MASTTTKLGIVNRALQLLGSAQISSLTENSRGAKAMLRAYDSIFAAELRANTWTFAIKRASISASSQAPIFGKARYFPLPGDFVFLAENETTYHNPHRRDWEIEGQNIVSSDQGPLPVRYVSNSITESQFDTLFAEAFASSLAAATCEEITNSNTKLQAINQRYEQVMSMARKRNSVERPPIRAPTCSFITVRA